MRPQHVEPQHLAWPVREQLPDRDEVTLRLRHLGALDLQEAVVQPVIRHHGRVERAARLRDLVLMVRKDQVDAAAVDVEGLAQMLPRHRRAFDVPAGTAGRPDSRRRRPCGLARLRGLPQHEVHRVALIGRHIDTRARDHLVERALRQPAVVGHRGHAEQHVCLRHIGVAGRDQTLDQRPHLADMLGGARLDGRAQAAERIDVGMELLLGFFGDGADRLVQRQIWIFLRRACVDLVVDVGDVARIDHAVGAVEMPQQPEQDVEDDDRPRIADMGEIIDGRSAHIHTHARRIERFKRPLFAAERIVEPKFHLCPSGHCRPRCPARPSNAKGRRQARAWPRWPGVQ